MQFVIEDAAPAVGATYRGRPAGAGAALAAFSFHPRKLLTTGEGGMLCTDDQELLERVRRLKFHGLGVDAFDRSMQGRAPQAEVQEPGYKYNLTDIAAALGRGDEESTCFPRRDPHGGLRLYLAHQGRPRVR